MNEPVIAIRTQADSYIGFGHLRRCLSLAKKLKEYQAKIFFIINKNINATQIIKDSNFDVTTIENEKIDLSETKNHIKKIQADVLIIDSYDILTDTLPNFNEVLLVAIEDRLNINYSADVIVNANLNNVNLEKITSNTMIAMLGIDYLLLDSNFTENTTREFKKSVQNVLITVGGSDQFNLTENLIKWTRDALSSVSIGVVIGPFFNDSVKHSIEKIAKSDGKIMLYQAPKNLKDLMVNCDIAISSGGQTVYELAATGTPTIAIKLVENQTPNLDFLSKKGTLDWIGDISDVQLSNCFAKNLIDLADNLNKRKVMSARGKQLIDAQGTDKVAKKILSMV